MRLSLALLLAAASTLVQAVFQDEVNHIDYHHELVGVPQVETTFFHRPRKDDRASLLYTLSDVGVLAAVNPSNGAVVWRQLVSDNNVTEGGGQLRAADGENWVASAYGRSVHSWNALTGRNAWWADFAGDVTDLEVMELTEDGRKDVLALFQEEDGTTVLRRLHGTKGSVVWEFRDAANKVPLQVSNNIENIFVVSLYGTLTSYGLRVSVHNTLTGKHVDDISLSTMGDVSGRDDVMFVGANSASPIVAWIDKTRSKLKINVLGTKSKQEFPLPSDTLDVAFHAPHLTQSEPHFLVHSRTKTGNKGEVYHIDLKSNAISRAYELPLLPGPGAFSTSSDGANVYFTRVTDDEVFLTSSESHAVLGRWPYNPAAEGVSVIHGVSEVVRKADDSFAVRSAAVTTSDDWVLVRNGELAWSRPEGLTGAVAADFAEIPDGEDYARTLEQEAHSNIVSAYAHRVHRHLQDLVHLPDYLASIPERFLGSLLGSDSASSKTGLVRDGFGFNKLAIVATRRGRLYGLNTGDHGRVVWSTRSVDLPAERFWDVKGIFVEDHKGLVTILGSRGDKVVAKTDTGELVEVVPEGSSPDVEAAVVVDSPSGQWLLPVGPGGEVEDIPAAWKPSQTLVVRGSDGELKGLTWTGQDTIKEVVSWIFTPPAGQTIVEVATRAAHDPVAQLGRVLGDRRVKYKYLNPNTAVVAAHNAGDSTLGIYLLDTVSGQMLHSTTHADVDGTKTVDCAVAENWFTCTFFGEYSPLDAAGLPQSGKALRGYHVVQTDLYESEAPNDRGPLGDAANYSAVGTVEDPVAGVPLPSVETQAWIISAPLAALAVTQTRQGISARQVLAYLPEARGIVGLPRQMLEPRRPVGRDPTPQEVDEGLVKYVPVMEVDPRLVISHARDVVGVREIVVAPATVESACLVLAYGGVDVFGTRVAPSLGFDILGKGFDKVMLIGTVLALVVGVSCLKPIVRRKMTDQRWKAAR